MEMELLLNNWPAAFTGISLSSAVTDTRNATVCLLRVRFQGDQETLLNMAPWLPERAENAPLTLALTQ
ncbi:hypothetical protein J6590_052446 [Homalodisca vitripennis]|nr:hypothetical protein J6590_052446 [Homalodisca vitripennis]